MNRRHFLYSSMMMAGAAVLMDFPTFAKTLKTKGGPNIKIGILSDIHILGPETTDTFVHALEYFRDKEVDGVLIAGDMADWGREPELQNVADAWFKVFPEDKLPNGKKVERLFIYGNHDVSNWDFVRGLYKTEEEFETDMIFKHREASWERCFKEKYQPIYMKNVGGYNFIGAHWFNEQSIDGLAEFLGSNHKKLAGDKPFFYFQHPHPKNTCNGPWVWGQDDGTVTELLSHYPNAIAFSGHSHCPLTDERDLWQGAFTSIGTASLRYQFLTGGRENSYVDSGPAEDSQMKVIDGSDGRHGMLMYVYDDCIALEKREFVYDQPLRENWIIPLGAADAPLSFENRAKTALVPQFNPQDKVTITRAAGGDRIDVEHKQITIHFPSVLKSTHGVRAFDYEVQAECRYVDIVQKGWSKHVYSPKCYLGEAQDTGEVTCVFAEDELPLHNQVRFAVRPCECFGGKGEPIYSEWIKANS